jgi:hypothetical protein
MHMHIHKKQIRMIWHANFEFGLALVEGGGVALLLTDEGRVDGEWVPRTAEEHRVEARVDRDPDAQDDLHGEDERTIPRREKLAREETLFWAPSVSICAVAESWQGRAKPTVTLIRKAHTRQQPAAQHV